MNTTNNGDRLNGAAEAGDIDLLYTVIQDDPFILEMIDLIPFVETPLHIAASMGHLQFASEIMKLKPSFAWKLNQQGFSPIHLAMQNNQKSMVTRFVNFNKDLVRVEGRNGITPLHFASQIGEVELLANFLFACPESIEYLTVRFETALHIAVMNEQYEALQVLLGWLKTNKQRGADLLKYKILNQEDENGNTIFHISALYSEPQALQLLIKTFCQKNKFLKKTRINLCAKNLENKTSLDMAVTREIKSILSSVGAKPGLEVTNAPTLAHKLKSNTTLMSSMFLYIVGLRNDISEEQRNTWLIVATLVATATFQSAMSPPGGVYQVNASDSSLNITSTNSTISTGWSLWGNTGKSVLPGAYFDIFLYLNMLSFSLSTITIYILIPTGGRLGTLVFHPVTSFVGCYLFSFIVIAPTVVHIFSVLFLACWLVTLLYVSLIDFGAALRN